MRRTTYTHRLIIPVLVVAFMSLGLLVLSGLSGTKVVKAAQPPPPTYYTLTVNTSGGDNTCKVKIEAPDDRPYTYTSDSVSYLIGTTCTVDRLVECPSGYRFDQWESNNADVDGAGAHGADKNPTFTLTQNTTATAVFVEIVLPDAESTIWHDHYTQNPHQADTFWHQVSLSSDPNRSFSGLTINEDFLTTEMDTSGCSMTLSQEKKDGFQTAWDGDWKIDSNNYRAPMPGEHADDKYDAHGFDPNATPWNQILPGEVFRLTQRMRVTGCISENNKGPWFATHTIEYKVIYNAQLDMKEVFVKKSGVQGAGDSSF